MFRTRAYSHEHFSRGSRDKWNKFLKEGCAGYVISHIARRKPPRIRRVVVALPSFSNAWLLKLSSAKEESSQLPILLHFSYLSPSQDEVHYVKEGYLYRGFISFSQSINFGLAFQIKGLSTDFCTMHNAWYIT